MKPHLVQQNDKKQNKRIVSNKTSRTINILEKVVTDYYGTASLADVNGYDVGGKTGTSQNYKNKNENLKHFHFNISIAKT